VGVANEYKRPNEQTRQEKAITREPLPTAKPHSEEGGSGCQGGQNNTGKWDHFHDECS
jgi:hypothetical protein